jgi:hypothetical protein
VTLLDTVAIFGIIFKSTDVSYDNKLQLNDSEVDMLIDTGSSINVIDEKTFKNLKCDAKLSKANTKVYTYGSNNTCIVVVNVINCSFETRSLILVFTPANFCKMVRLSTKIQDFPRAGYLLACGKSAPQFLHVVLFLGFASVCVSRQ